tara:strand:- start:389 stop:1090 length:702 start_codon:yes stop_codon:yes gene_type:complete
MFPSISIANFFDNPDEVLDLANSLEYFPTPNGSYPGLRTKPLHITNEVFFNKFCSAVFANFYNDGSNISYSTNLYFQKIPPFSKDKKNIKNKGWIHNDPAVLAGLVYLNKEADLDSGTAIYTPKKEHLDFKGVVKHKWVEDSDLKVNLYMKGQYNKKKYEEHMSLVESKFNKAIQFNNIFNTFICYHGEAFHRAENMNIGTGEDRLTLVFFMDRVTVDGTPVQRVKRFLNDIK